MGIVMRGRYRIRTWLRGRLPGPLAGLFPKGRGDCGGHEWYRADDSTWRCYHCEVGETHRSPWTSDQAVHLRLAALAETLRLIEYRDPTPKTLDEERRLVAEMAELVGLHEPLRA